MAKKKSKKSKSKSKSQARLGGSARYVKWVSSIRSLQGAGRRIVLAIYDTLVKGRDEGLWRESDPPWHSFERCLYQNFGIAPQRFANIERAVKRYGRDYFELYGMETMICLLRLKPGSPAENEVFRRLDEITSNNGGRPPSVEVATRIISQVQPPAQPLRIVPTENDRLRAKIVALEAEVAALKQKVADERRARRAAEDQLKKNRPRRRPEARA